MENSQTGVDINAPVVPQETRGHSNHKLIVCGAIVLLIGIAAGVSIYLFTNGTFRRSNEEKVKELEGTIANIDEETSPLQDELFEIFQREGFSEEYRKKSEELAQEQEKQIDLQQELNNLIGGQSQSNAQPSNEQNEPQTSPNKPSQPSANDGDIVDDPNKEYIHTSKAEKYVNKFSLPAITYGEFVSGSSTYDKIKSYYPQIKNNLQKKIGTIGNVKEDCNDIDVDLYMIKDIDINKLESGDESAVAASLYNTYTLQNAITCFSYHGQLGAKIIMPAGTFYFANGHVYETNDDEIWEYASKSKDHYIEEHVIKPYNNIYLKGRGNNEAGVNTTLKPFVDKNYKKAAAPDMFFYNDYAVVRDSKKYKKTGIYLDNNRYEDFIVDSEKARGTGYTTAGKGFMYNLFSNTDWNYVTVKNTDGTGFGVDAPINVVINQSKAIGCGKGLGYDATRKRLSDNNAVSGGSGFGIGTGFSNKENLTISNSEAIGNRLFGIFFEHQDRFGASYYRAEKGNFTVTNTVSRGNWYNYGGYRAYDLHYSKNNVSEVGCINLNRSLIKGSTDHFNNKSCTLYSVYFDDQSRRVSTEGVSTVMLDSNKSYFEDISLSSGYNPAASWITDNAIAYGIDNPINYVGGRSYNLHFNPSSSITRKDAITMIWRYYGYPGEVPRVDANGNRIGLGSSNKIQSIQTCFSDVPAESYYAPAVKWAYSKNITNGTSDCTTTSSGTFSPAKKITRAEFVTLLWRAAGRPTVNGTVKSFTDVPSSAWYYNAVRWAVSAGVTNGVTETTFAPQSECTRAQAIVMMCRQSNSGYCEKAH